MKNIFLFFVLIIFIFFNSGILIAQWTQTPGPGGYANSSCFAIVPSNNGTGTTNIFAGTKGNDGVLLSTDNGAKWIAVNSGLTMKYVTTLATINNGSSGSKIFAGTLVGGIFLSTNNGTSWTSRDNGLTDNQIESFAVSSNENGDTVLYTGTLVGGVFSSTDNGLNWSAANTGLNGACAYTFAVKPNGSGGNNLFAGTYSGIYLSTNSGASWISKNIGLTNLSINTLAVCDTNLFAGTNGGVFLSTNDGAGWTAVNTGLTNTNISAIAVKPNGTSGMDLFVGTGNGVFLSTNYGTSWNAVNDSLNKQINALAVYDTSIFAGTSNGIFISGNNGGIWTQILNTYKYYSVSCLAAIYNYIFAGTKGAGAWLTTDYGSRWQQIRSWIAVNGNINCFYFLTSNHIYGIDVLEADDFSMSLSTDLGSTWSRVLANGFQRQDDISCFAQIGTNLFAGSKGEGIYLLTSASTTNWTRINSGLTNSTVNALAVLGTNVFAGTQGGVFLSTDNGTSWRGVNNGLTNRTVYSLVLSGTDLLAGTRGGIFRLSYNDTSWTKVNNGLTYTIVNSLVVKGPNIYAGTNSGGVFVSNNNGANWTKVNDGMPNTIVQSLLAWGTDLYAGTSDGGVWKRPLSDIIALVPQFYSSGMPFGNVKVGQSKDTTISILNGGSDTLKISTIVSSNAVFSARRTMMNIPPGQSLLDTLRFAPVVIGGASGTLLFYSNAASSPDTVKVSGIAIPATDVEQSTGLPKVFALSQNYPNPFNPSTTLSFSLPSRSFVTLNIFDLLGREVASIVSEELPAGTYSRQWNAAKMSSGIYFYRLQAGSFTQTKRLVLLK